MTARAFGGSLDRLLSGRLFTVYFLPVLLAAVSTVALLWARKPDGRLDGAAVLTSLSATPAVQALVFLIGVLALTLLLQPVSRRGVAFLHGEMPALLRPVAAILRWHETTVAERWSSAAEVASDVPPTEQAIALANSAYRRLITSFPQKRQIGPTRLGNVLAAGADQIGEAYGHELAALWPRLYALLDDRMRSLVDDARDSVDAMAHLSLMLAVVGMESLVLAWHTGWWTFLSLIPLVACRLAYRGAVEGAEPLAGTMRVAVDLNRFELIERLRLELPTDRSAERELGEALSREWLQGVQLTGPYHHTTA